jgi:hypothetical protein
MRIKLSLWLILLFILPACQNQTPEEMYYLLLKGESETWKLEDYEIEFTSNERRAGDGILKMKGKEEYETESFQFQTYAEVDGEVRMIHVNSYDNVCDISEHHTGSIRNEELSPISFNDINRIYMTVEWWDQTDRQKKKEEINLYDERIFRN